VSSDEKLLIRECLDGRTEAFGKLVVRYQDRLYNTLFRILGSAEDAQDVAQDAFAHAFLKLKTFQGNAAFYSWLFRIALNAAASRQRKFKRRTASIDAARERFGQEPADPRPASRPAHASETAEQQALVQGALAQLQPEFRTALVLKEIDGLKYEEIAAIVGCPIGTVRSRIHRARTELRERLAELLREDPSPSQPQ
jgi:RNA polymerase sigma-70 factor (ECF subfamily)